jgi:phage tail-like protein
MSGGRDGAEARGGFGFVSTATVNPTRLDPFKNFKFRVKWDGKYVAGLSKISPLVRQTAVVQHREGGDPSLEHKSPGTTSYSPIVLERGISHDHEFEAWANKVYKLGAPAGGEVSLQDFRKDVSLELYNEAGQLVLRYLIYRCWVSEYQALPELDANSGGVAFEHITLENEGWARDATVLEPVEPVIA